MLENPIAFLSGILGVVVIDLVLSGDNAIVIAMAARRLPVRQRRLAIVLGGGGAIGLRVVFAAIASLLLVVPLLQAAGGILLLWVAWKLLNQEQGPHGVAEAGSMLGALRTIVLADVVMSLDNILAIAGVSHGSIELLLFGLLLSMPLILFGSGLIAMVMNRLPWLALVGAGILTWTAGKMIVDDQIVGHVMPERAVLHLLVPVVLTAAIVGPALRSTLFPQPSSTAATPGLSSPRTADVTSDHL